MSEPESPEEGPFASFAAPKISAVEALRLRREAEARRLRSLIAFFAVDAVACIAGSALAVGPVAGWGAVPLALGFAALGVGLGLLGGLVCGSIAWSVLAALSSRPRRLHLRGKTPAEEGSGDNLTAVLRVWGAAGLVLGAAAGATVGAGPQTQAEVQQLSTWALAGAALALLVAVLGWAIARRQRSENRP